MPLTDCVESNVRYTITHKAMSCMHADSATQSMLNAMNESFT